MAESKLVWDRARETYVPEVGGSVRSPVRDRFLRGPIPLPWLVQAARLPGKTLQVGLAIWYVYGRLSGATFTLKRTTVEQFGVSRDALYPALRHLEQAGLIRVTRRPGRLPVITVLAKNRADDGPSTG